jgi:hypothetical protein
VVPFFSVEGYKLTVESLDTNKKHHKSYLFLNKNSYAVKVTCSDLSLNSTEGRDDKA